MSGQPVNEMSLPSGDAVIKGVCVGQCVNYVFSLRVNLWIWLWVLADAFVINSLQYKHYIIIKRKKMLCNNFQKTTFKHNINGNKDNINQHNRQYKIFIAFRAYH